MTAGLEGATVRINDRRILDWMLGHLGFTAEERPQVLITIDKLDKIGPEGVAAEPVSYTHLDVYKRQALILSAVVVTLRARWYRRLAAAPSA